MIKYKKMMEEKMEKKKFTQEFKQDTIDCYYNSGKSIREETVRKRKKESRNKRRNKGDIYRLKEDIRFTEDNEGTKK